jgi:hypothetical protein
VATLSENDEGKFLVDADGEQLGIVTQVQDDTAWVDPDPGIAESWMQAFGWGDADEDDYTVDGDAIDTVTDDELRVAADL